MNLTQYYEEICQVPLMSHEEERDLFKEFHDPKTKPRRKDLIKEKIIRANLRYSFKKAKDYSKNDPGQFEDLIAAGNEGLVVGFNKFNHKSGVKFLTYAAWWVMQRQLKAMSTVRIVSLPIWKQQLSVRILKAQEGQEVPFTTEELCEMFPEVPEKDIKELLQTRYLTYHFDDVSDSEKLINPIEEEVHDEVEANMVTKLVSRLPEDLARIIELTFGFDDGKERKAASISRELGMPKAEVRAKRKRAMDMLKEMMPEAGGL